MQFLHEFDFFFATEFDAKISASDGIHLAEILATILFQIFGTKFRCWVLCTTITFHKKTPKIFQSDFYKFWRKKKLWIKSQIFLFCVQLVQIFFSKYWPVSGSKIGQPIGTNFCAKLDTRNLHPNQEFLVQYFGAKFGTRLFQTVTNFQLNFEPFRRSFLTQKFSATWLQIMKQFFKLFHNFKTGL